MTREQAIAAYQRSQAWADRQAKILREEILIPIFGGCGCRMHNCQVNWESGNWEGDGHAFQVEKAKLYKHRQQKIWEKSGKLKTHFAKYF